VQAVRMVFDLMPTETPEQRADVEARMSQVPAALAGIRASLLAAADAGRVSALRQIGKHVLQWTEVKLFAARAFQPGDIFGIL